MALSASAADQSCRLLGVFALLVLAVRLQPAAAAPCTLYKQRDLENARENARRYPWARSLVDGWRRSVEYAMKQERPFFERMVTELTNWPTYGQNCPACVGRKSSMGECGIYKWSLTDPDKLTCKYCGTVYPNPKYPETGSMTCPRLGQTFTYYETDEERAHPGENPSKYAFRWASWPVHSSWTGVIRSNKASWCMGQILPLAKLYAVTGEVQYAERCALILDRFAQVYPKWLFHSYNGTYADCPPAEAAANLGEFGGGGRFPKEAIIDPLNRHQLEDHAKLCNGFWGAGRFGCSGGDGGSILDCTVAYDLIRDAKHADGKPVLTPERDKRLVTDLLLAGCADSENWQDINNKCGPGRALAAAVGILFQRPNSVRWALAGFEKLMEDCFHLDGFCKESPSYSSMHLGLMQEIPEILRGYSDPEGYRPETGEPFRNLNPFEHVGRYRLALESMVRMLAPGKVYPVIGDTHAGGGLSSGYAEMLADRYGPEYAGLLETAQGAELAERGSEYALWYRDPDLAAVAEAGSGQVSDRAALPTGGLPLHTEWFPGWHVGVLRGGDPLGPNALYLNGYAYHGHRHNDTLGLIYYAFGKEIASDRGYIWDDPRNAWTRSTLSHNLVTVDGASQNTKECSSVLELFGAAPGIEVVQARSDSAYAQCDRYQRTCALVKLSGEQTYAVDFFRASGGKLHQYGFQCNGKLVNLTGPEPAPVDQQIKWLSNLRASQPGEPFTATWEYEGVKTDLTVLNPLTRLLVADAPGWRSDKGSELNAPPIQQVLAERTAGAGTDKLQSSYAAVMVPHRGDSPVKAARLLDLGGGALVVVVELGDRTDYVLSCLDDQLHQYGPVTMAGRFGFVSLSPDGKVVQAYLLEGTRLECGETKLRLSEGRTALKVASVGGRTFHLVEAVQAPAPRAGAYLLAGDTGYEIESTAEKSITVRDYPAVECGEVAVLNSVWLGKAL
jgi:hypothetical protein